MEPIEYTKMFENEDAHWWYAGLHECVLDAIARHKPSARRGDPSPPVALLDAGCGTGGMLRRVSESAAVPRLAGMDASPIALDCCGRRGLRGRIVRASLDDPPFADESFDMILSLDVLYHSGVRDDREALARLCALLRPGGVIILNLPALDWLHGRHDKAVHTARRYTTGRVRERLESAGMRIEKLTYRSFFVFPLIALSRMAERGRDPEGSDLATPAGWINSPLRFVQRIENRLLRRISFPVGSSVFAVARKPEEVTG